MRFSQRLVLPRWKLCQSEEAEPRMTPFRSHMPGVGRQMGAHPPTADEVRRKLRAKRLKSLDDGALAAPSHARVVFVH